MARNERYKGFIARTEASLEYQVATAVIDFVADLGERMEQQGVTRAELARRLGSSPAYVTKLLRGEANFTLTTMVKAAAALDARVSVHVAPKAAANAQVTSLSPQGLWLLLDERELFLSFDDFPSFRGATVAQLFDVGMPHSGHLHWPQLDVDLAVESVEHPERYPLIVRPTKVAEPDGER